MGSHLFSMFLCQFADYNCDFGIIQKLISSKIKWCSGCTWFFEFIKWRCGECNSCDAVIVIMTSLWTAVSQLFLGLQLRYWYQSKAILKRYCVIYRDKHGFVNSSNGISFSFGWIFVFVLGQISWSKTIQPRPLNTQQLKYIYQTHIHGMGILSYSIYYEQLGCLHFFDMPPPPPPLWICFGPPPPPPLWICFGPPPPPPLWIWSVFSFGCVLKRRVHPHANLTLQFQ